MSLIKWIDEFNTGIKAIDIQHKRWIQYINELHAGITGGNSITAACEIINKLVEYTKFHFKFEEDLFEQFNY